MALVNSKLAGDMQRYRGHMSMMLCSIKWSQNYLRLFDGAKA